ncbi:hypothetical protein SARC_05902 [Sphaeroforma arctica JP610]|uniref:SET domain-containing protein n=1 Tax=Sphaeroforma arctica JP610 TaxID=667725 RepID=A0A0L0FY92_9EUKA|nr:hypothetical protein SARC_05902 [Sphaeroforma arctica JP610]KNC81797.1 hypothetical protein SARC_05902 [Sphaeroforma arctica JP610]|eukprot:XP_014155699.1 hypothetical protein SARC_05902 [Sphaeroforma arctica JP610]
MAVDTLSAVGVATEPSDHLWAVRMLMAINCNQGNGCVGTCALVLVQTSVHRLTTTWNSMRKGVFNLHFGMQRECDGQVFATAVYLVPSLFNHNCTPNVCYRSEGRQLILSTNQAVEKGAELQHSYLQRSNLRTYEVRSEALENSYFFACACDTCANELTLPTEHEGQGHSTPHSDSSGDEAGCYWNSDLSDSD